MKITGVMHHYRGGIERSRNYPISPPWVQPKRKPNITTVGPIKRKPTSHHAVQRHPPRLIEDFNDRRKAAPQTLCLRHEGGEDVDNKPHMPACSWLVKNHSFEVVEDGRAGHSNDDFDRTFMVLLRWLK
jgi:hypothetical protein